MVDIFMEKTNAILGGIIAILAWALGDHWVLFAAFLLLNVADYITGIIASRFTKQISSKKGLDGILKKIGYWVIIAVGFGFSAIFIEIGKIVQLDLGFTSLIGWLVLAALIVNELRSIMENLVRGGYKVPKIMVNGLAVAEKTIDELSDATVPDADTDEEKESDG